MTPGGGSLEGGFAPAPPVSGVKHGLEHLGPLRSKLPKTSVLETEARREPLQLSPDDSKALDFDEPKIVSILGKQRLASGVTKYLVKWEGRDAGASYSWSPAASLAGCIDLLIRFEEGRAEKAGKIPVAEATEMAAGDVVVAAAKVDAAVRAMNVRCAAAEERAAVATAQLGALAQQARAAVGALELRAARAAAAEKRAEERAAAAEMRAAATEAGAALACDIAAVEARVGREVAGREVAREVAARVKAAQQRAAKRWWRERALAFEQVLEGWRDAAMLEQWPAVAAGTDMFAEAAAEDSLYCPELRMVVDLHVEDVD